MQSWISAIREAGDAAGQIRAFARMQAGRNPSFAAAARALDGTRHTDPVAAAAWADRAGNRMAGATRITEQLRAEGRLDPTWTPAEAAALLWELTSFRVWDDLVNDAQIPPDRYVEIITAAALSTLAAPITPPASRTYAQRVSPINLEPDGRPKRGRGKAKALRHSYNGPEVL